MDQGKSLFCYMRVAQEQATTMLTLEDIDRKNTIGEGTTAQVYATLDSKYAYKEYFSAVTYFDYMLSISTDIDQHLLAASSIYLAHTFVDIIGEVSDIVICAGDTFTADQINETACYICQKLDYNLYLPTFVMYVNILFKHANIKETTKKSIVLDFLMLVVENIDCFKYTKVVLCVAAMHLLLTIDDIPGILKYAELCDSVSITQVKSAIDFLSNFKKQQVKIL